MMISHKVLSFIKEYHIINRGDRVLLGVSGGPDSMFMLYILNDLKDEIGFSLSVATFNHKIRAESGDESMFVEQICRKLNIAFFYGSADVKEVAQKEKISLEEAARKERLNFLFQLKEKNGFNKIALAHNKDDFVETVLIHMVKGSGLTGLSGIKPISFNGIVHPILAVSRKEIEAFLSENKIPFKTDLTNYSLSYLRNRIRHQIVPLFTSMNENFREKVFRMGLILMEEDNFLSDLVLKDMEIMKTDCGFSLQLFRSLPLFEKRRIIKVILKENADFDRVKRVMEFLEEDNANKMNLYGNLFIVKKQHCFSIEQDKSIPFSLVKEYCLNVPGEVFIDEIPVKISAEVVKDFENVKKSNNVVLFDVDKIPLPLKVRFRKEGDKIKLENGTKKIQNLFIDLKIPREKRPYIPIVEDGRGNIIWVVGVRRSALYKIDQSTRYAVVLTSHPELNFAKR